MTKKAVSGGLNTRVYYLFIFITFIFFLLTGVVVFARTKAIIKNFIFNELGYFIQNVDARIDLFIEAKKAGPWIFVPTASLKTGLPITIPTIKTWINSVSRLMIIWLKTRWCWMPSLRTPLSLTLRERLFFPIMSGILERINREKNISGRSVVILKIRRF